MKETKFRERYLEFMRRKEARSLEMDQLRHIIYSAFKEGYEFGVLDGKTDATRRETKLEEDGSARWD